MRRFLFTPRWLAFHALVLTAMFAMVNLGLWQLRRLDERQTFNRLVTEHAAMDPVDGAAALRDGASLADWDWRPVTVRGTYVKRAPIEVVNRTRDGVQGRLIIGALQTTDGVVVLVNRGFLAEGTTIPEAPAADVEVTARVRRSEQRRTGQTADDASATLTQVRRIDLGVVGPQFAKSVAPVYLEALQTRPADAAGLQAMALPALDDGPHLSYAIQWFIFTICVAVGWFLAVRRSATPPGHRKRRRPPPIDDSFAGV